MNKNYVHTLAYNDVSMTKGAVTALYAQNCEKCFEHVIVDLGFPLHSDYLSLDVAKYFNSKALLEFAYVMGSRFMSVRNAGVSQNWNKVAAEVAIDETDILVGADPDEHVCDSDWVVAMGEIMREDRNIALCSLRMKEQDILFSNPAYPFVERVVAGHRVFEMHCIINMALIGINGKFLKEIGGMPVPQGAPMYGWIEQGIAEYMKFNPEWKWVVIADKYVEHRASPPLYGEWKQWVVSEEGLRMGQISFENYLRIFKAYK